MNHNIVITSRREDPFARVPKSVLDDERLSWKAKGILSYLLGKPTGWKVRVADLVRHSTDGECAVRAALKELRQLGYANLAKEREGGRIVGWVWQISDTPIFAASSPDRGFPDVENHHISKKEVSKIDKSKESKETRNPARRSIPAVSVSKPRIPKKLPPARFKSEAEFFAWAGDAAPFVCDRRPEVYRSYRKRKWKKEDGTPIWNFGLYILGLEKVLSESIGEDAIV